MEHLWAPWRNAYVGKASVARGETFVEIAQSHDDDKNFVLTRGKACFSVLNRYPYNTAHTLVLPYRVVADLDDLSQDELLELWQTVMRLKAVIREAFQPDGFNIGINLGAVAGAGIAAHLHVHLVPRWAGDVNFMTTTVETRVHPNDLPTVFRAIKEKLNRG